ncbi:MAG: (deoxy)nucleoside triphosphate pyrophosphohydrolase [Candidatus Methylomirabilales bacterium]
MGTRIVVTAGIITQGGGILICQRRKGSWGELKWEFPGGKVEDGEEPRESLRRELQEELDIEPEIGRELCRIQHCYPDREVELHVFHIPGYTGELRNRQFESIRWARREELSQFELLEADRSVIEALTAGHLLGERR